MIGYASRSDNRIEQKLVGDQVGDQTSSVYGANVAFVGAGRPSLNFGFNHRESTRTLDSVLEHEQSVDGVNASVTSSAGPFRLAANYRGEWSGGSYVSDDYQSHSADVIGISRFEGDTDLIIYDVYYRRVPTSTDAGAFGSEVNSFRATYRNGFVPGRQWTLGYSDTRAVTTIDANGTQTLSNSLFYTRDQRLPAPEYFLKGTADFSRDFDRERTRSRLALRHGGDRRPAALGGLTTFSTNENIAPGVKESWVGPSSLVGLTARPPTCAPPAGLVGVGYGVNGCTGASGFRWAPRRVNGILRRYFFSATNLVRSLVLAGSLTQHGTFNVDRPRRRRAPTTSASLVAVASRRGGARPRHLSSGRPGPVTARQQLPLGAQSIAPRPGATLERHPARHPVVRRRRPVHPHRLRHAAGSIPAQAAGHAQIRLQRPHRRPLLGVRRSRPAQQHRL